MRRFKPLKGLEHLRPTNKKEKIRKKIQRETLIEQERKPKIKRNGNLI